MKHLTPPEAVVYLRDEHGIRATVGTLAVWRSQGRGPSAKKLSGRIYYLCPDLDSYVDSAQSLKTIETHLQCESSDPLFK